MNRETGDEDQGRESRNESHLSATVDRLEAEFGDQFTRDTLDHLVADSHRELSSRAGVLTHIPTYVHRFTRQRLRALTKTTLASDDHVPVVLFVCYRNDAASQMASALFAARVGDRAEAHSAGTTPAGELLAEAVHALHEVGIETLDEFPKPLTPEMEEAADIIVTLDAHDDIPVVEGKRYLAWRLPDPAGEGLPGYRALRQELEQQIAVLVNDVAPAGPPATHRAFDADLLALDREVAAMGESVVSLGRMAIDAAARPHLHSFDSVAAEDDSIDAAHSRVGSRSIELVARWQPVASDLRHVLGMSEISLHLERIADGFVDAVAVLAETTPDDNPVASELMELAGLAVDMTVLSLDALSDRDAERAREIGPMRPLLDRLQAEILERLVDAPADRPDRRTIVLLDRVACLFARSAEHAVEIASDVVYLVTGRQEDLGGSSSKAGR